jgi:hypothetical protein
MGRGNRLQIRLSSRDRQQLDELLSGGLQPVRTVVHSLALRQLDHGQSTPVVGASLGLSAKAVWQIGKRYGQDGLDRALFDAARPGKSPALDQHQSEQIIAVVCSPPPEGRARWIRSTSRAQRTYSRSTKSLCRKANRWSASTRNQWCCMRIRGH